MTRLSRRRALKTLFCSSAALALNLRSAGAKSAPALAAEAMNLLALGDYGTGGTEQRAVAAGMRQFVERTRATPKGLLMLGDNFYGPTEGGLTVESERWQTNFEEMYPASVFPGPCWAVLGNHDYHDNYRGELAQLAYSQKTGGRWTMPAKWYRVDLGAPVPLLTLIFLDSNLRHVSGGRGKIVWPPRTHLTDGEEREQLAWFKQQLAGPRARFTIVVAHHPLYSNGDHGDTRALVEQWDGLLQEHRVHAYLCGHDHDLQHLELGGRFTSHVLSGGGGARVRRLESSRKTPFGESINGFTHLAVLPVGMTFTHHSSNGDVLHQFTKRADGAVEL